MADNTINPLDPELLAQMAQLEAQRGTSADAGTSIIQQLAAAPQTPPPIQSVIPRPDNTPGPSADTSLGASANMGSSLANLVSSIAPGSQQAATQQATQQAEGNRIARANALQPRPILLDAISAITGKNIGGPNVPGYQPPSKLEHFENFLGNFISALGAGLGAARGPGAFGKGFAAAASAPYERALQTQQFQGQQQLQQAQVGATEAETEQRRAQTEQMSKLVTIVDPVSGRVMQLPFAVAQKMAPGMFGAEAKKYGADVAAQTKLSIADMQTQIAAGKIAHVYPVRDANGNITGMQGYNAQGQPVGVLPGAVPPASLFGNTKFTANSDGSYSSVTTKPNIPSGAGGAPGGKTTPRTGGTPAATGGGAVLPQAPGTTLPPQVQAARVSAMENSTDPITNQAVRLVNGQTTLDELEGKTKQQVLQRADQYSRLKNGAPYNAVTGGAADPFGVKLGVTSSGIQLQRNEYTQASKTFAKDYIEPLNVLKKTTQEFQRIDQDPNQTGAEKVTALLNAVGISGDPLKGKGFRINQAIIQEHADARNIWEGAIQKLNKVFGTGGPITSKQISDYRDVAEGVVHDAYLSAAQEARRQGLPVDFLPRATEPNQPIDKLTAKIYLDVAGGDRNAARMAARKAGFGF